MHCLFIFWIEVYRCFISLSSLFQKFPLAAGQSQLEVNFRVLGMLLDRFPAGLDFFSCWSVMGPYISGDLPTF